MKNEKLSAMSWKGHHFLSSDRGSAISHIYHNFYDYYLLKGIKAPAIFSVQSCLTAYKSYWGNQKKGKEDHVKCSVQPSTLTHIHTQWHVQYYIITRSGPWLSREADVIYKYWIKTLVCACLCPLRLNSCCCLIFLHGHRHCKRLYINH